VDHFRLTIEREPDHWDMSARNLGTRVHLLDRLVGSWPEAKLVMAKVERASVMMKEQFALFIKLSKYKPEINAGLSTSENSAFNCSLA
jgi:hypothetical protein